MRSGGIKSVAFVHVDNSIFIILTFFLMCDHFFSFFQQTTKKQQEKTKENKTNKEHSEKNRKEQKRAKMSNKEPRAQYINMYCEQKWAKKSKNEQKRAKMSNTEPGGSIHKYVLRAKKSKNEQKISKKEQKQIVFHFLSCFVILKLPALLNSPWSDGQLRFAEYIWVFPNIGVPQNGWWNKCKTFY